MRTATLLLLLTATAAAQQRRLDITLPSGVEARVRLNDVEKIATRPELAFTGLKPGVYELRVAAKGFAYVERTLNLFVSTRIRVELEPGATLHGRVVRKGVPAGETTVQIGKRSFSCKDNGSFSIEHFPVAPTAIHVVHRYGMFGEDETILERVYEIAAPRAELLLEPDAEVRFSARLPDGVDEVEGYIAILPHESFYFHVHRGKQGQSRIFQGNRGRFYDYSARRKAAFVRVPGLQAGRRYSFVVDPRGCETIPRTMVLKANSEFAVTLRARRGCRVEIDEPPGWFVVEGTDPELGPDQTRGFLVEGVHKLKFFSDRYLPRTLELEVVHGAKPIRLAFELEPAPALTGTIAGVDRATIAVGLSKRGGLHRFVEVAKGRFSVAGLPPGRYEIALLPSPVVSLGFVELGDKPKHVDLRLPR